MTGTDSQMAAGLLYLADRGIVHTNVSLRSCLLSHANSVKLAGLKYARLHRDPSFRIDPADPALPYKVCLPCWIEVSLPANAPFTICCDR